MLLRNMIKPVTRISNRSLFTKSSEKRHGKTEIVLANNAGLFGTHWALHNHGFDEHENITVIQLPFWLDKIFPSHLTHDWGQTTLGYHKFVRGVLKQLYPNYPIDKYVTWAMIKEARGFVAEQIKKIPSVQYHDFTEHNLDDLYNNNYLITTNADSLVLQHKSTPLLSFAMNSYIYNWVRVARKHDIAEFPNIPHTKLYSMSPHEVPKEILVLGSGLSTVWLKKHFIDMTIFVLVNNKNDKLPRISSNIGTLYDDIILITKDDIRIKENGSFVISKHASYKLTTDINIPRDYFFTAIGLIPADWITQVIPDHQKLIIPEIPADSWVAPKNIPVGSLTQSLAKFFEETDNLQDTFELQFYHHPSIVDILIKSLHNAGIAVGESFFNALEMAIRELPNPIDSAEELKLFQDTFNNTNNPTHGEQDEFKKCVVSMQQTIQARESFIKNNSAAVKSNRSSSAMGKRFFSTKIGKPTPSNDEKSLSFEIQNKLVKITSIFFDCRDTEAILQYDKSISLTQPVSKIEQEKIAAKPLTEDQKKQIGKSLEEAEKSYKKFSAY